MYRKENIVKAPIFAISRLRMGTDGLGVTTLVAFNDCVDLDYDVEKIKQLFGFTQVYKIEYKKF